MTVYRLEYKDGIEPYYHRHDSDIFTSYKDREFLIDMASEHNSNEEKWPPPHIDIPNMFFMPKEKHIFGFSSLKQLKEWFQKWIPGLFKIGFKIVKINVDEKHVKFGKKQIAFPQKYIESKEVMRNG